MTELSNIYLYAQTPEGDWRPVSVDTGGRVTIVAIRPKTAATHLTAESPHPSASVTFPTPSPSPTPPPDLPPDIGACPDWQPIEINLEATTGYNYYVVGVYPGHRYRLIVSVPTPHYDANGYNEIYVNILSTPSPPNPGDCIYINVVLSPNEYSSPHLRRLFTLRAYNAVGGAAITATGGYDTNAGHFVTSGIIKLEYIATIYSAQQNNNNYELWLQSYVV